MPSTTSSRGHSTGSAVARRRRVVVPDAIPQRRLDRLGARVSKVRRYPGLKEEYYLHGFAPDPSVLDDLGIERERVLVVVRTPPEVSLYHRHGNPLFDDVLERLGARSRGPRRRPAAHGRAAGGYPRTRAARHSSSPSTRSTPRASSRSRISSISAGGTMNREAVALGVPVYTTFAGELGAVDTAARPRRTTAHPDLGRRRSEVEKRPAGSAPRTGRDPAAPARPAAHRTRAVAQMCPTG